MKYENLIAILEKMASDEKYSKELRDIVSSFQNKLIIGDRKDVKRVIATLGGLIIYTRSEKRNKNSISNADELGVELEKLQKYFQQKTLNLFGAGLHIGAEVEFTNLVLMRTDFFGVICKLNYGESLFESMGSSIKKKIPHLKITVEESKTEGSKLGIVEFVTGPHVATTLEADLYSYCIRTFVGLCKAACPKEYTWEFNHLNVPKEMFIKLSDVVCLFNEVILSNNIIPPEKRNEFVLKETNCSGQILIAFDNLPMHSESIQTNFEFRLDRIRTQEFIKLIESPKKAKLMERCQCVVNFQFSNKIPNIPILHDILTLHVFYCVNSVYNSQKKKLVSQSWTGDHIEVLEEKKPDTKKTEFGLLCKTGLDDMLRYGLNEIEKDTLLQYLNKSKKEFFDLLTEKILDLVKNSEYSRDDEEVDTTQDAIRYFIERIHEKVFGTRAERFLDESKQRYGKCVKKKCNASSCTRLLKHEGPCGEMASEEKPVTATGKPIGLLYYYEKKYQLGIDKNAKFVHDYVTSRVPVIVFETRFAEANYEILSFNKKRPTINSHGQALIDFRKNRN